MSGRSVTDRTQRTIKTDKRTGECMVDRVLMAYVVMGICVMGLLWFIKQRTQRNRAEVADANKPAVAGDDELGGVAKDPGQFEEPDDDALDEMEDMLRTAAEAQGLEYEGD